MQENIQKQEGNEEFRHLVRLSGVVLDGNLDIVRALARIKGIGSRISYSLVKSMGLDPKRQLGAFNDQEIEELEKGIESIEKTVPVWMLNREKDNASGENMHLTGADLDMAKREDINLQKRMKSYKGIRHSLHLPVRGQRTKTSFRKGSTVGVKRKKGR